MMKFLVMMLITLSSVFAKEVKVECKILDEAYRNQFATEFSFDNEADRFTELPLKLTLRKLDRNRTTEEITVVRSGTVLYIPAGEVARDAIFVLSSLDTSDDLIYLNLAVDIPTALISIIRFQDDMSYFSTCRSVK